MKKILILMMVVGLMVGATTADAAQKKKKKKRAEPQKVEREATGTYTSTAVIGAGLCAQEDAVNCVRIPAGPEEIYVKAVVKDNTGQTVPVAVKADLDGDNRTEKLYGTFCGETEEPIQIDPGVEITFWVGHSRDTATDGRACAPPTQGSIVVTFSNMP